MKAINQALQRELQQSIVTADFFKDSTHRHIQVIDRIVELAEGLKTAASTSEGLRELVPLLDFH